MNCIYCQREICPNDTGDHVIPAALGEFRKAHRFKRICRDCNAKIGKSEAQLLRCGPEALFRQVVVQTTTRSRGKASKLAVGAEGMPPPQVHINHEGNVLTGKFRSELNAIEIVDQLVVKDKEGKEHFIRLYPRISVREVKEALADLDLPDMPEARFNYNGAHSGNYIKLLAELFPGTQLCQTSSVLPGFHNKAPTRFTFRVNDRYFRAVAKMAFHYYLLMTSRASGTESFFQPLRRFIIEGGKVEEFFRGPAIFTSDVPWPGAAPTRWVHFLGAYETERMIVGYVRLFYGPRSNGCQYHVLFGRPDWRIITDDRKWVHAYIYDEGPPAKGKIGTVQQVSLTRLQ